MKPRDVALLTAFILLLCFFGVPDKLGIEARRILGKEKL